MRRNVTIYISCYDAVARGQQQDDADACNDPHANYEEIAQCAWDKSSRSLSESVLPGDRTRLSLFMLFKKKCMHSRHFARYMASSIQRLSANKLCIRSARSKVHSY
jgi:hypothetical protein